MQEQTNIRRTIEWLGGLIAGLCFALFVPVKPLQDMVSSAQSENLRKFLTVLLYLNHPIVLLGGIIVILVLLIRERRDGMQQVVATFLLGGLVGELVKRMLKSIDT
jgi:hypothetical protein